MLTFLVIFRYKQVSLQPVCLVASEEVRWYLKNAGGVWPFISEERECWVERRFKIPAELTLAVFIYFCYIIFVGCGYFLCLGVL
jgi:hypothetical protein